MGKCAKKGQYYIIGVAIIIFALSGIIGAKNYVAPKAFVDEDQYLFGNLKEDFFRASNAILYESTLPQDIESNLTFYIGFSKNFTSGRNRIIEGYIILGVPYGDSLNITVANLYNTTLAGITVNISAQSGAISSLSAGSASTLSFPLVFSNASSVNITYSFESLNTSGTFSAGKKPFEALKLTLLGKDVKITRLEIRN